MREILIFAGTTEGRALSEYLTDMGVSHTLCVATEYGEVVLKKHPLVKVRQGRMNQAEIKSFILDSNFLAVVDATHPYAQIVTQNIKAAMEGMDIPYLRLKREGFFERWEETEEKGKEAGEITFFASNEACAKALSERKGKILLTTGSKELSCYCMDEELKSRLCVRILPSMESLSLCMGQGICGKQIIAMQGPFTAKMNEAIIRQYGISCLVTKESGASGGFYEKLEAARKTGVKVFVIGRPQEEEGYSFSEICRELAKITKINGRFKILLAGGGMGNESSMTKEVKDAVDKADILFGAERMLAPFKPKMERQPFYHAEQIVPYLEKMQETSLVPEIRKVVVLFSGDSGFYSGCQMLYHALAKEIREGRLQASLRVLPGVSSVAAFASRIGESYHDASIYSMHGKELPNLIRKIKTGAKTFLLMSGVKDVNRLGNLLEQAGMQECEIIVGYQLSYQEEEVKSLSPKECCGLEKEGLYICMVRNKRAVQAQLTHGRADGEFVRSKVPMSKEEVREIGICKLHLYKGAILYDIGSGTGSIAAEAASLSDEVQVYAVEQRKEAVSLIEKNKEKFGLENITVVEARAPEGIDLLPAATHAFIGGSGGKLREILASLYRVNPKMRIVINAVSMETLCEIRRCMSGYRIENEEMIQVQVNRVKEKGSFHMMQAENPVWICAFDFAEGYGQE